MPYVNLRVEFYRTRWDGSSWANTGEYEWDISDGSFDPDVYWQNTSGNQDLDGILHNATNWNLPGPGKIEYAVDFDSDTLSYTINNDNSIVATLNNARFTQLRQYNPTGTTGTRTRQWRFYNQGGTVIADISRGVWEVFTQAVPGVSASISGITIPPGGNSGEVYLGRLWSIPNVAPAVGNLGSDFYLYARVVNDLPPDYRPGQRLQGGTWYSHNRSGGKADKRTGGSWATMRTANGGVGTDNPPFIRTAGVWRNQKKVGLE